MRKIITIIILSFLYQLGSAQDNTNQYNIKQFDFSEVNFDNVNKANLINKLNAIKQLNDSLNGLLQTDSLYQLYLKINSKPTTDFNSWYLSAGPSWSNFSSLNKALENNNYPTIGETGFDLSYVIAFAWKRRNYFHDLNMQFTFGSSEDNDSLEASYSVIDILSYKFGYSIINAKRFDLTPYAGINFRLSNITFENKELIDIPGETDNYTDFTALAFNRSDYRSTTLNKFSIPLDYGVEMNYHIKYSKRNNGITLGARYGQALQFIDGDWKNDGEKLNDLPEINLRESYLTFICRFYWRTPDKNQPYPYSTMYE